MRWPWVSREDFDAQTEQATSLLADERQRYDALLEKYHALRTSGASVPEPKPEPRKAPEPDAVTQAIIKKSGNSKLLRKHYAEYVANCRAGGIGEDEIAQSILVGETDDGGVPA